MTGPPSQFGCDDELARAAALAGDRLNPKPATVVFASSIAVFWARRCRKLVDDATPLRPKLT